MKLVVPMLITSAALGGTLCAADAFAQSAAAPPKFSEPTRLKAGEAYLGEKRLFPSPVYHDIDGDGLDDVVIGDLKGVMTVALRKPGAGPVSYGEESKLLAVDGKELNFHNW